MMEMPGSGVTEADARHRLWLSLLEADWKVLAIVPADASVSARSVAGGPEEEKRIQHMAAALAHLEEMRSEASARDPRSAELVRFVDAQGAATERTAALLADVKAILSTAGRAVVLVDPVTSSMAGTALTMVADAVLLVARLGSGMEAARRTATMVGRHRILGCAAVAGER